MDERLEQLSRQAEELAAAGEFEQALERVQQVLAQRPDPDALCQAAGLLEALGDAPLACVYYGRAAAALEAAGDDDAAREITDSYDGLPQPCREIYETARTLKRRRVVLTADRPFQGGAGRAPELARAFAALGMEVQYIEPSVSATANKTITAEALADWVISQAKTVEGIRVVTPAWLEESRVDCRGAAAARLALSGARPLLLAFSPADYDFLAPLKGRCPILFDCGPELTREPERWQRENLIRFADAVLSAAEDGPGGAWLLPEGAWAGPPDEDAETALWRLEHSWLYLACRILRVAGGGGRPEERIAAAREPSVAALQPWECVGCLSCLAACPAQAITLRRDRLGFAYPQVDEALCTRCGACLAHCPVRTPRPVGRSDAACYAAAAPEAQRAPASSGGIFPALAEKVLSEGGAVCGVVFDAEWNAVHVLSDDPATVRRMYGSKYVASSTEGVFPAVRAMLETGRTVLFSGCPCQTMGLSSFLGRSYPNLILVSIICHGVPSPAVWQRHLKSLKPGAEIVDVSFRSKEKFGWNSGVAVRYADGGEYVRPAFKEPYIIGFSIANYYLRDSCYHCRFKSDTVSDISLGDFWGIEQLMTPPDGKGVSVVSVNSEKGRLLLKACAPDFPLFAPQSKAPVHVMNWPHRHSAPENGFRHALLEELPSDNLQQTYDDFFTRPHFDVALAVWFACNYGNSLTYYGLYKALTKLTPNVVAIDTLYTQPEEQFVDFARRHYRLASDYFPSQDAKYLGACCDRFLSGSDQVWNPHFHPRGYNGYFHLAFAPADKPKIGYGGSFGGALPDLDPKQLEVYRFWFKRYRALSTRERFGKGVLRDAFGVKGEYVLDPVFLPDRAEWEDFAASSGRTFDRPFIAVYYLFPWPEKLRFARRLQKSLGDVDLIYILDAEPRRREQNLLPFSPEDHVETALSPEEFVAHLSNCCYVLSDSFHGSCFSTIFEKPFLTIVPGFSERLRLIREFGLGKRLLTEVPQELPEIALEPIDYERVNREIRKMRKKSLDWLSNALNL